MKLPKTFKSIFGPSREKTIPEKAAQDNRIMADGRPAFAWWNEIQMLHKEVTEIRELPTKYRDRMIALRVAEWATEITYGSEAPEILIRLKMLPLVNTKQAEQELMEDPGKFCEIVEPK